jgi:Uma2 family endonuclease
MAVPQKAGKLTEAEYLAIERAAEFKSEFYDGEMFAMAGGTVMHSLIATNLAVEFGTKLKGRSCLPFNSDLRLKVEASVLFTYPDLSVICGEPRFANDSDDTVTNPTLLAEVLSDSTESYDRGTKFDHYKKIPELREYLLIRQKEPCVEQFIRQSGGDWLLRQATGLEALVVLPSLDVTIALSEIYANVKFPPASMRSPMPRR